MRIAPSFLLLTCVSTVVPSWAWAATREVGAGKAYETPCAAFAAAEDDDTIEIAAGTYTDMCGIGRNGLTIRGVGGRPIIDAQGGGAQGKGIWIITGTDVTVDNVELVNAAVRDRNGAGIRMEGKKLTVRNTVFRNNENGILTNNVADAELVVERCEFDSNGDGRGQAHNMYIGAIKRFALRESWSHGAKIGHLVKSRAAENVVEYNRLTGETGTQSYELEFPMGGRTVVIGNVIEQGPTTDNPGMLAYAQEGLSAENSLVVAHNTFVNRLGRGTFVLVHERFRGEAKLVNNIFAGTGTVVNYAAATQAGSCTTAPTFVDAAAFDFHLAPGSACLDTGVDPGMAGTISLTPTRQYLHPTASEGRAAVGALDPGAFELGGGVPDGSSSSGGASSGGSSGSSGSNGSSGTTTSGGTDTGDGGSNNGPIGNPPVDADESGCATSPGHSTGSVGLLVGLGLAMVLRRRRDR